jgi:hypothetical protein
MWKIELRGIYGKTRTLAPRFCTETGDWSDIIYRMRTLRDKNFSNNRDSTNAGGWVKRSGPTEIAAIGGSDAALLDSPYESAPAIEKLGLPHSIY